MTDSAANEPDVTTDPGGPATYRARFEAEFDVEVEVEDFEQGTNFAQVRQALQDALGYTGLVIYDVTEYEEIP